MDRNWGHDKLGSVGAHPFFTVSTEYCIYRFQYMTDKCVANSVSRTIGKSTLFPAQHQYL